MRKITLLLMTLMVAMWGKILSQTTVVTSNAVNENFNSGSLADWGFTKSTGAGLTFTNPTVVVF